MAVALRSRIVHGQRLRWRAPTPYSRAVRDLSAQDPAEVVLAWEAVEELLAAIPEGLTKDILRMVAAGMLADEIAERLGLAIADVEVLAARGRIRVLTAAIASGGLPRAPR